MPRWPERFVVLGDAVCSFNPIYGQGMSTAAVAAETLDACLSTGQDLRFPTTTGMRVTAATRLLHRYLDQVGATAIQNLATAHTLGKVMVMLARPTSLFAHRVLAAMARPLRTPARVSDDFSANSAPQARPAVPVGR